MQRVQGVSLLKCVTSKCSSNLWGAGKEEVLAHYGDLSVCMLHAWMMKNIYCCGCIRRQSVFMVFDVRVCRVCVSSLHVFFFACIFRLVDIYIYN